MSAETSTGDPSNVSELDVPPERRPRHVAIIMDGNGRWAEAQGLPRIEGHRRGADTVDRIVTESRRLGLQALTLYSFSSENWKRPAEEVAFLMNLCVDHLQEQRDHLRKNEVRFRRIGRDEGLPEEVLREAAKTEEATRDCTGLTLCLALNYGARAELLDATASIAREVRDGILTPEDIDEQCFAQHLYTSGIPDPDLLLRTAGEMRISNFLLWQISYSELVVTDVLWPDFQTEDFHAAIRRFANRDRRFGGLGES